MVDENTYAAILGEIVAALDKAGISFVSESDAMSAALVILQEMAKDRRMQQIHAERNAEHAGSKPARAWRDEKPTQAQIDFLMKHKIPFMPGITKGQASDLIDKKVKAWQGEG